MQIIRISVGQLRANCYLLVAENLQTLIIDPGDDAEYIIEKIQQENLIPQAILATHGHFDHIMAVWQLQVTFQIPFFIDKNDKFLLQRMQQTAEHFIPGVKCSPPPNIVNYWQEQKVLSPKFDNFKFEIIKTPGHSPGSISYYFIKQKSVFVGDVVFASGMVGRTDFNYCNAKDLRESLQKLFKLPVDTIIYPGHGEEILLSDLKVMF